MKKTLTLSERKRLAILNAAQDEFNEKGYAGVSMDAIAKRAEVSKRTVYNHFPSKEALFQAIVKQLCDSFSEAANVVYQPGLTLEQQLMEIATKELELLQSDKFRNLNRIILGEFIRSPELAAQTLEQFDHQENSFTVWIKAAIEDGRIQQVDPDYAGHQFMGLIKATAFWPQLLMNQAFPSSEQQKQIAEDTVIMFLARYQSRS
ncbi:TetR/AcrR family transcriptional regulator [Endozoicomonas sp. G2_1]|uniref:TetR/AcrR family transcriptional regulator n=1 Tax=Endozoicomonas sp. G2_1 TaxID=2821091 RepID=UPI001ADC77B5|nr:TetR/AcrR family transcriptional regulator [Endozoicomonas sp. G2_1]MBO9489532.1 TetR/AcrR family transcriptional regulator [Endozoicomonas sp. G2_1]